MNYLVTASLLFSSALSHSWLECVDYKTSEFDHYKLGDYDPSKCNAYPRGFERQYSAGFGIDTGFNWPHAYCAYPSSTMKTAVVNPGSVIYMSHPSKNHVAEPGCTNQFIPSTSFNVIVIPKSQAIADGSFTNGLKLELIGGDHVNGVVDFKGYQRCYQFCDNMDKSHCISGWKIPEDMAEGEYTGLWLWEFNVKEYYSSCFDFTISGEIVTSNSTSSSGSNTDNTSSSGSVGSSSGSSTDNSNDTTIEIPKSQMVPTSTPSSSTQTPEPSTDNIDTPASSTDTVNTDTPAPSIDIITSDSPTMVSPILTIGKYVLNITGLLNITLSLLQ